MKKGKSYSSQSDKKEECARVLVPLLSHRESDGFFIEKISEGEGEIILLLVIDTKAMPGQFGFAANDIASGNQIMGEMRKALARKKRECCDVIEWGETANKIEHLAMLRNARKVFLVEQESQFFKKLVKELEEKLGKVEIVRVKLPEPPKK